MSTILKALRRLEQEKAATEESRPLREQIAGAPYPGGEQRRRRGGWLGAVLALVLGVGAGAGAIWWLFGSDGGGDEQVAAAPVAPPAASAPPSPPTQAFESDVEIVDRPEALPRLADADPVAAADARTRPGSRRPVESSTAAARAREAALAERAAFEEYAAAERARLGLPPPHPGVAAASQAPAAPPMPIAVAEPPPAPRPAPAAPAAASAAPPPPESTRELRAAARPAPPKPASASAAPVREPAGVEPEPEAKPAPIAAARPSSPPPPAVFAVAVEKTQWHPLADRRIAWLRVAGEPTARRVVEGDVVEGMLVASIEPSGVVFERDGEQTRRALGER